MPRRSFNSIRTAFLARRLARACRGATSVEYGFILALIALTILAAVAQMGDVTKAIWTDVHARVASASNAD